MVRRLLITAAFIVSITAQDEALACSECGIGYTDYCPEGMTCKVERLVEYIAKDGCRRYTCAHGTLQLYDQALEPLAFTGSQLYCTSTVQWTNYSVQGSPDDGTIVDQPFSVNCPLPIGCEECRDPAIATSLAQLPPRFQTGFTLTQPDINKEADVCTELGCADGILYGFSDDSETGLEHTSAGQLECDGSSLWRNYGGAVVPANILIACLTEVTTTTTTTTVDTTTEATTQTTTTALACGPYDAYTLGDAVLVCVDGQTKVSCPEGKKIEIMTTIGDVVDTAEMVFLDGEGWATFDDMGRELRVWETGADEIMAIYCEGFM